MIGDDDEDAWLEFRVDAAILAEGAAAGSADDLNKELEGLPRILRYALLARRTSDHNVAFRLVADIDEVRPGLAQSKAWSSVRSEATGLALAVELDRLAVADDLPLLRSLADCVRLQSLTLPCHAGQFEAYRRVTRALVIAFDEVAADLFDEQRIALEQVIYGFAALPTASRPDEAAVPRLAVSSAVYLGDQMIRRRLRAVKAATVRRLRKEYEQQLEAAERSATSGSASRETAAGPTIVELPNHVVVGRLDGNTSNRQKLIEPIKKVLNVALPLVLTPDLAQARAELISEFPYAVDVIDFALTDLISRPTAEFRPLLLCGEVGSGKSRFARRFCEVLGLTIWRVDGGQADGSTLAGTDRRWHSAEPCHPLLAMVRGGNANPAILIDEIDKASTRTDYGRLWDSLLGLLEPETSSSYPDPALQIPLDLSHVSYLATANVLDPLPSPLRDRFRIVKFPQPTVHDLDALLPALLRSLAAERNLDDRWLLPFSDDERAIINRAWPGGSVRRLRHVLEVVLRARDSLAQRH